MTKYVDWLYDILWGTPALILILGIGLFLTVYTCCIQIRLFPGAVRQFREQVCGKALRSGYRALCSALAATVGTGNLVGVSGAICLGGPGAVFWMLLCAFLGMAVKFAEASLAVRFQTKVDGESVGGPMYMIQCGLGKRWLPLACFYCISGLFASFGIGNCAQVNAIVTGIRSAFGRFSPPPLLIGVVLALLLGSVFLGGAVSVGRITEKLVPVSAVAYVLMCAVFLCFRVDALPGVIRSVFEGVFSPKAVTGGIVGSTFRTMQIGCSRGVFSNEAGMGTASIAHGAAEVRHPVQQGMMGMIEVLLDTFVICTMTALVILCSGAQIPFGTDVGASLTVEAFSELYGKTGEKMIAAFLSCFAFATILGWSLYGLRCAQFLFGSGVSKPFYVLQIAAVILGAVIKTPVIWRTAELLNGMMLLPNLTALIFLSPELRRLINSYTNML